MCLLCRRCLFCKQESGDVLRTCQEPNRYYLSTRYPNALPGGIPYDVFTADDGREALEQLPLVTEQVAGFIEGRES